MQQIISKQTVVIKVSKRELKQYYNDTKRTAKSPQKSSSKVRVMRNLKKGNHLHEHSTYSNLN